MVYNQFYEGVHEWFLINKTKEEFFEVNMNVVKKNVGLCKGYILIKKLNVSHNLM